MTVATELCHAERAWTGVETLFAPGIEALDVAHILLAYRAANGVVTELTRGLHIAVTRDVITGVITASPLAMPPAPGTVIFDRFTPAQQATNFANLDGYDAGVHTRLHDAAALRDAELRQKLADLRAVVDYPRFYLAVDAIAQPGSAEVLARHVFADAVAFAADLAGSVARAITAPAAAVVFSLQKNGAEFATLTFDVASHSGSFAGVAALFEPGDVLTLVAPSPRDATLADIFLTLAGSRQ